jgi:hypothetical protein
MPQNPLWSAVFMGLVRYALFGVGVWMIDHKVVTESQWTDIVIGVGVMAGTIAWMAFQKQWIIFQKRWALAAPAGTTEAQLNVLTKQPDAKDKLVVSSNPSVAPRLVPAPAIQETRVYPQGVDYK